MSIHIPTVFVMLLLGYGLLTLQISMTLRSAVETTALRIWNWGSWTLLAGFVALIARGQMPLWLSILATTWLLFLGVVLYTHAIYHFLHGRGAPRVLWVALLLACVSVFFMLGWPRSQRSTVVSLLIAGLLLPTLGEIWRTRHAGGHTLRMVAVSLLGTALAMAARALHAWWQPHDYGESMYVSLGQGLTFIFAYAAMLGAGFGFILAVMERTTQRLHELATHDGLTGCINRTTFDTILDNAVQRSQRDGEPVSLLMFDIDHFKSVNDQHGHRTGDEVLRRVADTMLQQLRTSDVLARVGGEEFCVLLPNTHASGAAYVAQTVRKAIEDLTIDKPSGGQTCVTLSGGLASATKGRVHSADQLYQRADDALYRAKANGRNRVESDTA